MNERPSDREATRSALRRVRGWLGLSLEPPLPRPPASRLHAVRRFGPLAIWQARSAVVAGVPLADFLRARLARYEAGLGMPLARLPLRVELADGEIRASAAEDPTAALPAVAPMAALITLEGQSAERRAAEASAEVARLETAEAAARSRADALALRLSLDVAAGSVAPAPDLAVSARELGRPAVRSPAGGAALGGAAAAAVAAEAWAVALPMLRATGIDPPRLGADLVAASLVCGGALGVAVGLVALALGAITALTAPARTASRQARRRLAGGAAVGCLLSAVVTAAAAGAPVDDGPPSPLRTALLLLALPAGSALAIGAARREARRRAVELEAALAWDRARADTLAGRGRRLEELALAATQARAAALRCRCARGRVRALSARAEAAARLLARAAHRERLARFRLALSLAGALERDRYEYLRQATARSAELATGARAAEEPRPGGAGEPAAGSGRVAV